MDSIGPYGPIIGAVIGAILALTGGFFSEPLRERFFGPRLHIDCPDEANKGESHEGFYIKVCVRNSRRRMAKSCRVYLTALHEIRDGKPIGQSIIHDSFQLPWAGYDFEPRDIPNGVSQFVDIVKFSKNSLGWVFATKPEFYRSLVEKTRTHRGTYRLTILAAADGATPCSREVDVYYDQIDWRNARVWLP